ncbi:MAG: Flp family type IVb pilin [Syntrophorhabdus sp.]
MEMIQRLLRDEEGVTAIEYGLIACLIALGIILAVTAAGEKIAAIFDRIAALPVPA